MNLKEIYLNDFGISEKVYDFVDKMESQLINKFNEIETVAQYNQCKVLKSMQQNKLSDIHFSGSTGYGYNDIGREVLESIYRDAFKGEAALVRPQLISGTHALTTALFGNLHYGDEILSPVGAPYDTLIGVIGIRKTKGSLMEHGIGYKQVELIDGCKFDYENIEKAISKKTKLVTIQRSKGYAWRKSFEVLEIKQLISFVKNIDKNIICMVDNCYGEFVDYIEPLEVGADLIVGSLIKNPGGGLAPVGGYIVGKEEFVENAAFRLTAPGLGKEVGPTLGVTGLLLQGFFAAPNVVGGSLKTAVLASNIFQNLGYEVNPKPLDKRSDIVQAIKMNNAISVIKFCEGIQKGAPVDSFVVPEPWAMPGYDEDVIMAAGSFVQGSSIELSADAPIKPPYNVYMQGGLTYYHGKIGVSIALNEMVKSGIVIATF